jgi:putative ABC transport system substrate-binding protein
MERREVVFGLLALCAADLPLRVDAQAAPRTYRIGVLSLSLPPPNAPIFKQVADLGYVEGRNLVIEYAFADGQAARLPGLAADLVAKKVDLIIAPYNDEVEAAMHATSTIPIVMVYVGAPVEFGYIASLARPGGNVTGTANAPPEVYGKSVGMLRDALPHIADVAVLYDAVWSDRSPYMRELDRAFKVLGIRSTYLPVTGRVALDAGLDAISAKRPDALLVLEYGTTQLHLARVIEFAARQGLPSLYMGRAAIPAGGLMSYAPDYDLMRKRAATFIDRIFKGAKPADLPVEQPTKYSLFVNLKTAKALGLKLPQSFLMRADEVIE